MIRMPFILFVLCTCSVLLKSQSLLTTEGIILHQSGNVHVSLNQLDLVNFGMIKSSSAQTRLTKDEDMYFEGTKSIQFNHVLFDLKNKGYSNTNIEVTGDFELKSGILDIQDQNFILSNNESRLLNERVESRITSNGLGEIIKYHFNTPLSNEDIGNLGLTIQSTLDVDTLEIRRGQTPQSIPFGQAIERYYKISTRSIKQNMTNIKVRFLESEVNQSLTHNYKKSLWYKTTEGWNIRRDTRNDFNSYSKEIEASLPIDETLITVGINTSFLDPTLIPTVFTPNGDGVNDFFVIPELEKFESEVEIFTIEGQLLYSSSNYSKNPWNGKFNEKLVLNGFYAYRIQLKNTSNDVIEGEIAIIK